MTQNVRLRSGKMQGRMYRKQITHTENQHCWSFKGHQENEVQFLKKNSPNYHCKIVERSITPPDKSVLSNRCFFLSFSVAFSHAQFNAAERKEA